LRKGKPSIVELKVVNGKRVPGLDTKHGWTPGEGNSG